MLDQLYPIHGHPLFDFIGFKATPEESYDLTIDFKECYQYVHRPIGHIGENVALFMRRRHELGKQYQNALRKLLQEEEKKLGFNINIIDKAIIELKSSAQRNVALSNKLKRLTLELINKGFKIYVLLAQFDADWRMKFSLIDC